MKFANLAKMEENMQTRLAAASPVYTLDQKLPSEFDNSEELDGEAEFILGGELGDHILQSGATSGALMSREEYEWVMQNRKIIKEQRH